MTKFGKKIESILAGLSALAISAVFMATAIVPAETAANLPGIMA